jgi:hypothetical protein
VKKRILALAMLAAPAAAAAQDASGIVRFIACPVYRDADAGRKSGCWLADDPATGKRWDVSLSPYKPDWNYAVLVEGRPSSESGEACGGAVLDPVRTSRLYDQPCLRHMLPAEGYPGRRYKLQGRYIHPLAVPREVPPGPYGPRTFPVYFEFDSDFLVYQYDDYLLDRAVTWIRAAGPRRLVVTGYAATDPVKVSGRTLAERPDVAAERAEMVAETLRRLLPAMPIELRTELTAQPTSDPDADAIPGQSQRRAEIKAEF